MGNVCGRLAPTAQQGPPETQSATYVSERCEKHFKRYPWDATSWACGYCRANWIIIDCSDISGTTYQMALHAGGQEETWTTGDAGLCRDCDVPWLKKMPQETRHR